MYFCMIWMSLCMICEFEGKNAQRSQVSALWQKPGSAAEGTFGRRTWLGRQAFRLPKLPPKRDFRLCLGLSAAEGAAEHA